MLIIYVTGHGHVKSLVSSFEDKTRADEKYEHEWMCRQVFENNKLGNILVHFSSTIYTTLAII